MGCWIWEKEKEHEGLWMVCTTDENVELVQSLIMSDRRSLRDIARQIGINSGAVQSILTDILGISKLDGSLESWPKIRRAGLIFLNISCLSEDDSEEFMRRVVNQDETWAHHWSWGQNVEYAMEAPWLTPS